jgi:hypothetical protein
LAIVVACSAKKADAASNFSTIEANKMHYKITRAWIKNGRLWYFVEGRLAPELTPVFSKSFGSKPPFATAQVKQQDGLIVWAVGDPASEADATPEQLAIGPQLEKVDLTQASLRQMMQDHAVAAWRNIYEPALLRVAAADAKTVAELRTDALKLKAAAQIRREVAAANADSAGVAEQDRVIAFADAAQVSDAAANAGREAVLRREGDARALIAPEFDAGEASEADNGYLALAGDVAGLTWEA